MVPDESEPSFRIIDRRGRGDDSSSRPAETRQEVLPASRPVSESAAEAGDPDRNLIGLFMMLGSSALMALGEADPQTGQRAQRDLPMAAEVVDVLLLLREKTEGRRSGDESQVLDQLLHDLQLRYVTATKRPG